MKIYSKLLIIAVLFASIAACKSKEPAATKQEGSDMTRRGSLQDQYSETKELDQNTSFLSGKNAQATAPVIIFKLKNEEYAKRIMVALDETRTKVTSYPSRYDAKAQIPTPLDYGFYLDKRGFRVNMVVLKYTYKEWSAMESTPSQEDMLQNILDKEPFEEVYFCGRRSDFNDNLENDLNKRLLSVEGKAEEIFKKAQ